MNDNEIFYSEGVAYKVTDTTKNEVMLISIEDNCKKDNPIRDFIILEQVIHQGVSYLISSIEEIAFEDSSFERVLIPKSIKILPDGVFYDCKHLREIIVAEDNDTYTSIEGVLFDKQQRVLLCCPSNIQKTSYKVPKNVTKLSNWAFARCYNLRSILLPESLLYIGVEVFAHCPNLREINLPQNLTTIEDDIFRESLSLEKVCSSIQNLDTTSIDEEAFYSVLDRTKLYVPKGTIRQYEASTVWRYFYNIYETLAT